MVLRRWVAVLLAPISAALLAWAVFAWVGAARADDPGPESAQGNGGALVMQVSTGTGFTCARMSNGRLLCWGANPSGVLGDGTTTRRLVATDVLSITAGATTVSAGNDSTCAVVSGGAYCWGANASSQLGVSGSARSAPVAVTNLSTGVTGLEVGTAFACAVVNGGAQCWGRNNSGQLGANVGATSATPVQVGTLTANVAQVSAGGQHACAVVGSGAQCWGNNVLGQLGVAGSSTSTPQQVTGLTSGVSAVAAGGNHTCALVNGGVQCWGYNASGQLGNGTEVQSDTPVAVTGLASGVSALTSGDDFSCAIIGAVAQCWGRNDQGQLGTGASGANSSVPVTVTVLAAAPQGLAAGTDHACALLTTGSVQCWGYGGQGEKGAGFSDVNVGARTTLGLPGSCIFTGATSDSLALAANWSNCGGGLPLPGDAAVVGRAEASGLVPQLPATGTLSLARLTIVGTTYIYGAVTTQHLDNLNLRGTNGSNIDAWLISPGTLTVTTALTWPIGSIKSTGTLVLAPGSTGLVDGPGGAAIVGVVSKLNNSGTLTMLDADMGAGWVNQAAGVINFNGNVYCCSVAFSMTNYGTINAVGTNRIASIEQYSGMLSVQGTLTKTSDFKRVTLYGGTLAATGVISGAVDNIGGVVAPGGVGAAGALAIADYYKQSPTATLSIDIGGISPGQFDQLTVLNTGTQASYPGRADLAGALTLNRLGGYVPPDSADVHFIAFNVRNGWFTAVTNGFAPGFVPTAFAQYGSLVSSGAAHLATYVRASGSILAPGADTSYVLQFENPLSQTVTVQEITYTLPISFTYKPGQTSAAMGEPTVTQVANRQQLHWSTSVGIPATSLSSLTFAVTANVSASTGTYTSTISVRDTSAPQGVTVNGVGPIHIQSPYTTNAFQVQGSVTPRAGQPPLVGIRRAHQADPFLVTTLINCPSTRTCTDPATDITQVTLRIGPDTYVMTAGEPPATPNGSPATPLDAPSWANPPKYHHWTPGLSCAQQLPSGNCDQDPGDPNSTPDCKTPFVVTTLWSDGSTTKEIVACGGLFDPSGYVRDAFTQQPIAGASVALYRMPFALPDTATETRQCRTVDTRPGGAGGSWSSLPSATVALGVQEDSSLLPARIDPAVNPQLTDPDGYYGWDVETGCWFIVVTATGYQTYVSPVVGVPPAVLDLNVALVSSAADRIYLPLVRK